MELIAGFVRRGESHDGTAIDRRRRNRVTLFRQSRYREKKKHRIYFGVSYMELIAGFEPATSSLPRKRSTSLKGITLPFFRQQKPQDIVVFILSSYYHETFANFLIAFLSANVCKYLVLDRFIAV